MAEAVGPLNWLRGSHNQEPQYNFILAERKRDRPILSGKLKWPVSQAQRAVRKTRNAIHPKCPKRDRNLDIGRTDLSIAKLNPMLIEQSEAAIQKTVGTWANRLSLGGDMPLEIKKKNLWNALLRQSHPHLPTKAPSATESEQLYPTRIATAVSLECLDEFLHQLPDHSSLRSVVFECILQSVYSKYDRKTEYYGNQPYYELAQKLKKQKELRQTNDLRNSLDIFKEELQLLPDQDQAAILSPLVDPKTRSSVMISLWNQIVREENELTDTVARDSRPEEFLAELAKCLRKSDRSFLLNEILENASNLELEELEHEFRKVSEKKQLHLRRSTIRSRHSSIRGSQRTITRELSVVSQPSEGRPFGRGSIRLRKLRSVSSRSSSIRSPIGTIDIVTDNGRSSRSPIAFYDDNSRVPSRLGTAGSSMSFCSEQSTNSAACLPLENHELLEMLVNTRAVLEEHMNGNVEKQKNRLANTLSQVKCLLEFLRHTEHPDRIHEEGDGLDGGENPKELSKTLEERKSSFLSAYLPQMKDEETISVINFIQKKFPHSLGNAIKCAPDLFLKTLYLHPGVLKFSIVSNRFLVYRFLRIEQMKGGREAFDVVIKNTNPLQLLWSDDQPEGGGGGGGLGGNPFIDLRHPDERQNETKTMVVDSAKQSEEESDEMDFSSLGSLEHAEEVQLTDFLIEWIPQNLKSMSIAFFRRPALVTKLFDEMHKAPHRAQTIVVDLVKHAAFESSITNARIAGLELALKKDKNTVSQVIYQMLKDDKNLQNILSENPHLVTALSMISKQMLRKLLADDLSGWKPFLTQLLLHNDFLLIDSIKARTKGLKGQNILLDVLNAILNDLPIRIDGLQPGITNDGGTSNSRKRVRDGNGSIHLQSRRTGGGDRRAYARTMNIIRMNRENLRSETDHSIITISDFDEEDSSSAVKTSSSSTSGSQKSPRKKNNLSSQSTASSLMKQQKNKQGKISNSSPESKRHDGRAASPSNTPEKQANKSKSTKNLLRSLSILRSTTSVEQTTIKLTTPALWKIFLLEYKKLDKEKEKFGAIEAISSKRTLKHLILDIFIEKVKHDEIIASDELTVDMTPYVCDYFMNKFGLRSIVGKCIHDLIEALVKYRFDPRVKWFINACQLDLNSTLIPGDLDHYLRTLRHILLGHLKIFIEENSLIELADGSCLIPVKAATAAVHDIYHGILNEEEMKKMEGKLVQMNMTYLDTLKNLKSPRKNLKKNRKKEGYIDYDDMMEVMMNEWKAIEEKINEEYTSAFHQHDNSNEIIGIDQFVKIIHNVTQGEVNPREARIIFYDIGEDYIDLPTLLDATVKYDLRSIGHDNDPILSKEDALILNETLGKSNFLSFDVDFQALKSSWEQLKPQVERQLSTTFQKEDHKIKLSSDIALVEEAITLLSSHGDFSKDHMTKTWEIFRKTITDLQAALITNRMLSLLFVQFMIRRWIRRVRRRKHVIYSGANLIGNEIITSSHLLQETIQEDD